MADEQPILYGPTLGIELSEAGLGKLPISWTPYEMFGREALTPQQNTDLDAVLAVHDPTAQPANVISASDFVSRFTNQEYLAVEKKRRDDIAANKVGYSKNWDIVVTSPQVDMGRQKVQTLKDDLVLAGVLTQARADEIFS
jgi:hypothetical protein